MCDFFVGGGFWKFLKISLNFSCVCWNFFTMCSTFPHSFTQFLSVFGGSVSVGRCAFLLWGNNKQLNNCFWKIQWPL